MVIVGLADSLDPHARGPAAGRRVRATDDLPLAGLVSEPISNLRFRRVDANRASQGLPKSPSSQPRRVRFSRMEYIAFTIETVECVRHVAKAKFRPADLNYRSETLNRCFRCAVVRPGEENSGGS
jgi:hypothetical protein